MAFRAAERLFSLLMQAAGRAGRDAEQAARSEMWIQTANPLHPLYQALVKHDFDAFAASQLEERRRAGLPPFSSLALVRAEARDAAVATAFLQAASDAAGRDFIDFYNLTMATPYQAAERGYIDAVIEPATTRLEIRKALAQIRDKQHHIIERKHLLMPI